MTTPDWLRTRPIAHRGLHKEAAGIIENTPTAFEKAAEAGYPIELDVHLSADGEVIVFHDDTLDRLTGMTGPLAAQPASVLTGLRIRGSGDTIPTLSAVMDQIGGRVPLLIELKSFGSTTIGPMESAIAALLENYRGEAAVQSFNPYSMGWFARNADAIPRGQLSGAYSGRGDDARLPAYQRFALRHLMLNYISRPHFIAYEAGALPARAPARARKRGLPLIAWTVRDEHEANRLAPHADNIIFENFQPQAPRVRA
jgi:glycerophosphoryl diester phosphodiesterase